MRLPTFEQFAAVRRIGSPAFDPSGEWLAYIASTSGQQNLWIQPSRGGFARQLTALSDWRVSEFAWSPGGDRIAFTADHHGDEQYQVYVIDAAGGWPRKLTDAPEAQHALGGWLPDGSGILVSANDREPSEIDPQVLDPDTGERDRLMTGGQFYAFRGSPDGRWATLVEFKGNTDQDIHLFDLERRTARVVTAHEGESIFVPVDWARDSRSFYLLTNHERELTALAAYRLDEDRWQVVHAPPHDVEGFALARNGETTLARMNVDGASRLQAYDMTRGEEIPLPGLPYGEVQDFTLHPTERRAVLALSRATEATNLYHLELGSEPVPLEQSMLGGIDLDTLVDPGLVSFASFDRDVPAWLYRPEGPGPHPFVVSIHGGPEAQERPRYAYDGLYQYLLSRGIGVLAPNIRGSTGYGRAYQKLIHRDWGGDELEDIRHAAEWLRAQEFVDGDRIGVYGGSFGGFATLSALARLPEYWAVGVDVVGPSNLVTFASSVPPHWRPFMRDLVGDPEDDREMLEARSPITYVDRIRAPLLVIQGANDPRVVQAESDQMVERLRERGLEVEYYVDPEGGHGASDTEGRLRWYRMIAEYLETRLAIGPPPNSTPNPAPSSAPDPAPDPALNPTAG